MMALTACAEAAISSSPEIEHREHDGFAVEALRDIDVERGACCTYVIGRMSRPVHYACYPSGQFAYPA